MMKLRGVLVVGSALWLAACGSPQAVQSLEDRAKAGDPVASCQILVTKLQACAEEISIWKAGGQEPFCSYNRPRFNDQAFVNEVLSALKSDPARHAKFGQALLQLSMISFTLETNSADQNHVWLDDMSKKCPSL